MTKLSRPDLIKVTTDREKPEHRLDKIAAAVSILIIGVGAALACYFIVVLLGGTFC